MDKQKENTSTGELARLLETAIAHKAKTDEPIKYVIYVRKSTDEEGKQIRSIEDQIAECKDFARKTNLDCYDLVEEKLSAKESGKRPLFRKMLQDIEKGKYGGVLSWHPDRLSRNMKEAGEIIDLLDKDIIRDLKFVSFTFNNDPSGKLLLGITFAMSKEYSDKLSVNVMRGNKHQLLDGNYVAKSKSGYYKDASGKMRPDGENFKLLKEAFYKRLAGESLEEIASYINQKSALAQTNSVSGKKLIKFRKQDVGELIKESAYTGVLIHGKQVVDLNDIYDFEPMVTPDEFLTLNKNVKTGRLAKVIKYIKRQGVRADFLRRCVYCSSCDNLMSTGLTTKRNRSKTKSTNYFYFRCDTKGCAKKNTSTRAKVIIEYASNYIKNNFTYTENTWLHYKKEMQRLYRESVKDIEKEFTSLVMLKKHLIERQEKLKDKLLNVDPKSKLMKEFEKDFEENTEKLKEIEVKININRTQGGGSAKFLGKDDFIELMQKLPDIITSNQEMGEKDLIIRSIYLNFYVDGKKVVKSSLNSPFDVLFGQKVPEGAR